MAGYLFSPPDGQPHEITYDQLKMLFEDNQQETQKCQEMTESSYRGENFYDKYGNTNYALWKEYTERDSRTSGMRVYYPHGVVVEQAQRANYYRGENKIYSESIPTLLRELKHYRSTKEKELYRLVCDMRVAEFRMFLQRFEHVKNWDYSDVLYDLIAQHYGLNTGWLDITNDFNVALFFATCYWDRDYKEWRPLTKKQTEDKEENMYGVIYHMPSSCMVNRWTNAIPRFQLYTGKIVRKNDKGDDILERVKNPTYRESVPNLVMPIGLQPFMRCSMQNGYGIYMRQPQPLQNDKGFERLCFRHSEKLSNKVFDMMRGGELIYPHEGLKQAEFIIQDIAKATSFSMEAFREGLYRNHYYSIKDENKCMEDLNKFSIEGHHITIGEKHPWKLSSNRRRMIDNCYKDFSVEKYYGIHVVDRKKCPSANVMFDPWMLPDKYDGNGVKDFKVRDRVQCESSIADRNRVSVLHTIFTAEKSDF